MPLPGKDAMTLNAVLKEVIEPQFRARGFDFSLTILEMSGENVLACHPLSPGAQDANYAYGKLDPLPSPRTRPQRIAAIDWLEHSCEHLIVLALHPDEILTSDDEEE